MGKAAKKILKGAGVVLAVIIVLGVVFAVRGCLDVRKMTPMETGEVMKGIFAVRDGIGNLFILKSPDGFIAIDAGTRKERARRELTALNIDPEDIKAVFLTHTDSDHVGAIEIFTKATVYISSAEEQMVDGRTSRFFVSKNKLNRVHTLLEDDQRIVLPGFTVRAILTPGHTPGATCYVVNDSCLFVGDSMSIRKSKGDIFISWINMDSAMQRESLKKLMNLPDVKHVFTGHFGYSDHFQTIW